MAKGGIQRGNKVATRNYKSLKVIDLRIVLLEPSGFNKNNEQLSNYQMVTRFCGAGGFIE